MSETILVTGATCPTGDLVVRELIQRPEVKVRCLVRNTSRADLLVDAGVLLYMGDLTTGQGLTDAMNGVDTVIHIAGVRFVRPILQGMRDCRVHRGVFVNTTGGLLQVQIGFRAVPDVGGRDADQFDCDGRGLCRNKANHDLWRRQRSQHLPLV